MLIEHNPYDIPLLALYNGEGFQKYELMEDTQIFLEDLGKTVTIPKGFKTDGRSAGILTGVFETWGKGGRAWLLHDWMYVMDFGVHEYGWTMKQAQEYADKKMFDYSMELNPSEYIKNVLCYWAVNIGGARVYEQNREVMERSKSLNIIS